MTGLQVGGGWPSLKFLEGERPGTGGRGSDMRAGCRITQTPLLLSKGKTLTSLERSNSNYAS